ncbi:MAG: hypothetical protein C4523_00175, partial [Myxococcales bacterium]
GGVVVAPLPDQVTINTWYAHEQEQYFTNKLHFARFGEWSPILAGIVGASYSPIKYVSFGVSLQALLTAGATMDLYMPSIQADDYAKSNIDMRMTGAVRPIVGVQAEPTDWMALGLTWKLWSSIDIDGKGQLLLWNYRTPVSESPENAWVPKRVMQEGHNYVIDYEPMEVTGGLGFKHAGWHFQGNVIWEYWPHYRDHHGEKPEDAAVYDDNVPANDGSDYKWKNRVATTMSTGYRYVEWAESTLGFAFYPSPVPEQDGRTSYVDSDTWCISVGQRFDFSILGPQFHAELGLQYWQMNQRTVYKDPAKIKDEFPDDAEHIFEGKPVPAAKGLQTNNPGFPGYSSKGWMIVGAASFAYEF